MQIHRGLEQLVSLVQLANQFFQLQKPWKMDSSRKRERINSVLFLAYETVRLSAIFLQPLTPQLSHKMLTMYANLFISNFFLISGISSPGIPLLERTLATTAENRKESKGANPSDDFPVCFLML
jgi:hypothetical protein